VAIKVSKMPPAVVYEKIEREGRSVLFIFDSRSLLLLGFAEEIKD
jgi:hypothetical protein